MFVLARSLALGDFLLARVLVPTNVWKLKSNYQTKVFNFLTTGNTEILLTVQVWGPILAWMLHMVNEVYCVYAAKWNNVTTFDINSNNILSKWCLRVICSIMIFLNHQVPTGWLLGLGTLYSIKAHDAAWSSSIGFFNCLIPYCHSSLISLQLSSDLFFVFKDLPLFYVCVLC